MEVGEAWGMSAREAENDLHEAEVVCRRSRRDSCRYGLGVEPVGYGG